MGFVVWIRRFPPFIGFLYNQIMECNSLAIIEVSSLINNHCFMLGGPLVDI